MIFTKNKLSKTVACITLLAAFASLSVHAEQELLKNPSIHIMVNDNEPIFSSEKVLTNQSSDVIIISSDSDEEVVEMDSFDKISQNDYPTVELDQNLLEKYKKASAVVMGISLPP